MKTSMLRRHGAPVFIVYAVLIVAFSTYVVLDTFAIRRTYAVVASPASQAAGAMSSASGSPSASSAATVEEQGHSGVAYAQQSTNVALRTDTYCGSTVYVADIYAQDVHCLLAAFADNAYGRNVTAATSKIAADNNALIAINGDCYGLRSSGYVVRNGVLYRDQSAGSDQEDLVIYEDGRFEIVREGDVSAQELVDAGAWQVFSFGPGLVENGVVLVDGNDEVDRAKASNPRTAIAKVSDGHYVLVVSDGRTEESQGLSLAELATYLVDELGVECAYNLDGGGSSTMVYENELVNVPTSSGHSVKERSVSDIVYVS